jgi:hypothetical protein
VLINTREMAIAAIGAGRRRALSLPPRQHTR